MKKIETKAQGLVEASREFVSWFDYISNFQKESLIIGQTLESASENWNNMTEPSPPIDKLRKALQAWEGV